MVIGSYWNNYFGSQESNENCRGWWHRMASILVYLFLPVAGLTMFWLRKEFLARILIRVDELYLPVTCPVFGRTRSIVGWARTRLPPKWSSHANTLSGGLADFWKDGSLLCTLINSAIPGACPNPYRHWNKPLIHAQEIAYKYLGIVPVFTESDFSCQLSTYLETKLLNYLIRIRKSIHSLEKDKTIYSVISPKFVARGMGLYTAEQFQESEFFVYSKYDHASFFNIEIVILGPYSTYCRTTVLEYLVKESRSIENDGSTPKSVSIRIELERERLKVAYIANNYGIHEIILSCNKESIMGSPFYVNVLKSSGPSTRCEDNNNFKSSEVHTKTVSENDEIANEATNDIDESNDDSNKMDTKPTDSQPDVKNHTTKPISNKSHIADSQTMEISKYLKDLSNSQEKKVNMTKNIFAKFDKIWGSYPDYFTRENYAYFQKLVDNSFRKACRITRAHPKFCQKAFAQFSNASPICNKHIDPEGVDEKRKIFSMQKSSAVGETDYSLKGSSLSINESMKETNNNSTSSEQINKASGESPSNAKCQTTISTNEKSLKRLNSDTKKRRLQKIVQEKKLFWESVFNESSGESKTNSLLNETIDKPRNSENSEKRNLSKPVDSLKTQGKCQLSRSLSDMRRSEKIKKIKTYRSLDCNLDMCCEISLENRAKAYLDRARSFNGDLVDDGAERYVSKKYGTTETNVRDSKNVSDELGSSKATWSKNSIKRNISYFKNLDSDKLEVPSNRVAPLVMVEANIVEINISLDNNVSESCMRIEKSDTTFKELSKRYKNQKKCNTLFINKERRSGMNFFDVLY